VCGSHGTRVRPYLSDVSAEACGTFAGPDAERSPEGPRRSQGFRNGRSVRDPTAPSVQKPPGPRSITVDLCTSDGPRRLLEPLQPLAEVRYLAIIPTYPHGDFWRFTPAGIAELFTRPWPNDFTGHALGSLRTCVAFLMGEVQEDLPGTVLDYNDSRFPLTVAVEAHKTST